MSHSNNEEQDPPQHNGNEVSISTYNNISAKSELDHNIQGNLSFNVFNRLKQNVTCHHKFYMFVYYY